MNIMSIVVKVLYLLLSTLIAYFIKGITGFGNTLVMGLLFSFIIPNRLITPVDLLISIPTNAYLVWRERRSISLKVVIPLSLVMLIGTIPGTILLKSGNDRVLKSILGIVVVGIAMEMLIKKPICSRTKKGNRVFLIIIGVVSGILTGLYGIGALLIAYINRTTENRNQFRGNICCVFMVDNIFRLFLYLYKGILNKEVVIITLFLLPAVILGMILGIKIDAKMKEITVRRIAIVFLAISGTVLFLRNIFVY